MTHFKNYNNTIDTLKQLGENQFQIKTVTTGDIFEIDLEKNTLYPLMHINPVNAVVFCFYVCVLSKCYLG